MSGDTTRGDGMGVSSEREGHAGPGQHGTDGVRYTGPADPPPATRPEQSRGGVETNPDPVESKAGYPSRNPRSKERPYRPGPA